MTAPPGIAARHGLAAQNRARCRVWWRRARSTTPTPTSAPTSRTPTASTPRASPGRQRSATRTSSGEARRRCSTACARRATAILVSKETITDYSLKTGDLLKLRVLDHATGTVSRRAVPRRRHRPGVPLGAEGLVHGHEPRVPPGGGARPRPERRLREDERRPSVPPQRRSPRRPRRTARSSRTSASRPSRRSARSRPST